MSQNSKQQKKDNPNISHLCLRFPKKYWTSSFHSSFYHPSQTENRVTAYHIQTILAEFTLILMEGVGICDLKHFIIIGSCLVFAFCIYLFQYFITLVFLICAFLALFLWIYAIMANITEEFETGNLLQETPSIQ